MIAWYGEQQLKDAAMARLREHRRLGQFVQGTYYPGDGRGCHLGCLTHQNEGCITAVERMFGINLEVAEWLEKIFEFLQPNEARRWVIEGTEAIPVGADLSRCAHDIALFSSAEWKTVALVAQQSTAHRAGQLLLVNRKRWRAIAAKSIEIFASAPVERTPSPEDRCESRVHASLLALGAEVST